MAESCYSLQVHVLFWVCACAKLQMLLVDNSLGELRILSFKHHCVDKYDPDVPKKFCHLILNGTPSNALICSEEYKQEEKCI